MLPDGKPLPVILCANKCDIETASVNKEEMDSFCKENGFIGWFETSAKENINIHESAKSLVENILKHNITKSKSQVTEVYRWEEVELIVALVRDLEVALSVCPYRLAARMFSNI